MSKRTNSKTYNKDNEVRSEKVDLKKEYEEATDRKKMRQFFVEREMMSRDELIESEGKYDYLYPSLDDPMFNMKIASRKEFFDTQYDGKIEDVESAANEKCSAGFELAPHQAFVRNFLSFQTPYNGLLLYHGLGSGKTCSAISVAEEMRDYLKQMGISKKIIVVASPNVQDNFRLQLFDERKLVEKDGLWNIRACVGDKFLRELNPTNVRGIPREKLVNAIKRVISASYMFVGYLEFANFIERVMDTGEPQANIDDEKAAMRKRQKLRKEFDNRLVIIDEAHEIRMTDDNKDKRVATKLMELVRNTSNMRLLLLSATPMYNSYREIIWLLNILNINDKRPPIELRQVFDENGDFKTDSRGDEVGRQLLERKATGYVSFVRGENPYTFPFKVWPSQFAPEFVLDKAYYPRYQMNNREIVQRIQHLELFVSRVGDYQETVYNYILDKLRERSGGDMRGMPSFENMEAFGYTLLQRPLEALNIAYPSTELDEGLSSNKELGTMIPLEPRELVGKNGLQRIMRIEDRGDQTVFKSFEYRDDSYPHIFAPDQIANFSSKMAVITQSIMGSEGIVLIYSQYIDGGLVPMALVLEELGFTRYGEDKSLFKTPPTAPLDVITYKPMTDKEAKGGKRARYVMITGDRRVSPDNMSDFLACTNDDNMDGSMVKVILLSQAGGQGLDFANIRQVHILEPWYNMNRIEQVIGRAVRNCSHKSLPFEKRNVEVFLHGSVLSKKDEEPADLYVYRTAENKAVQVGRVSRVLKEVAIDCLLNMEQQNFTETNMGQTVSLTVSTGQTIEYAVGDKPYTFSCDYQSSCEYKCKPVDMVPESEVKLDTYSQAFIESNNDRILHRVRDLFRERHLFTKDRLINEINVVRNFPLFQIDSALTQLVTDKNELVTDMFGRIGRVVNKGMLYLFQPMELTNENISLYDRRTPLQFKRKSIVLKNPRGKEGEEKKGKAKDEKAMTGDKEGKSGILNKMRSEFDTVFSEVKDGQLEDEWYKYARLVVNRFESEAVTTIEAMEEFVAAHIIEKVMFDDFLFVINHLEPNEYKLDKLLSDYIEQSLIEASGVRGLVWQNKGVEILVVKGKKGWTKARPEDVHDLQPAVAKMVYPVTDYSTIFGFMTDFKNELVVFKVKQMEKKRNTGARCDQAGKKDAVSVLNLIVADREYNMENTKSINQREICVMQEFMLRLYNKEQRDGKIWFFGPGMAALNKVEKASV